MRKSFRPRSREIVARREDTPITLIEAELRRTDLGKKGIRFEVVLDGQVLDTRTSKSFDFHGALLTRGVITPVNLGFDNSETPRERKEYTHLEGYFGREDLLQSGIAKLRANTHFDSSHHPSVGGYQIFTAIIVARVTPTS